MDAAGGAVALHREHPTVAAFPRLGQCVRQERQGPGLPLGVAYEQVDQTGFETEPSLLGGALDGGTQRVTRERTDQMEALFGEADERGVSREACEVIGANSYNDRRFVARACREPLAEGPSDVGVVEGEDLLELIHDYDDAVGG
jgi:hypothetical protein